MRPVTFSLFLLLLALQFKLWVGEGSLAQLWQVRGQVKEQQLKNSLMQARNDALAAEVVALQKKGTRQAGLDALEGLARNELGMVRKDETFFFMPD
ncbi:FtsB family cell division protein [Sansalvadorimonas verongulae]|uniref:FtsB family cell division protein n=1 Tax=Sansalvadorimonas verongulae TaxID=2172824 RepID=UPI0012BBA11E|nr:septum formation initiator family protein [Sansalvadorimonas verongulae]MTI14517.1 cell division protein FtsB [Sansalvadorimonas verongulae]